MNIKEIRDILWPKYDKLSDEYLLLLDQYIRSVCDYFIEKHIKEKQEKRKSEIKDTIIINIKK